jgi:hypothetical protein
MPWRSEPAEGSVIAIAPTKLAARHRGEPAAPLLLASVSEDVGRHETLDAGAELDDRASELFRHDGLMDEGPNLFVPHDQVGVVDPLRLELEERGLQRTTS